MTNEKAPNKFEEKEGESEEERKERLKIFYTKDHQLDSQIKEFKNKAAQRVIERRIKGEELNELSKTPLYDEFEWMQRQIGALEENLCKIQRSINRVEESVKNTLSNQITTINALREIWQTLLMNVEWDKEKFLNFKDWEEIEEEIMKKLLKEEEKVTLKKIAE